MKARKPKVILLGATSQHVAEALREQGHEVVTIKGDSRDPHLRIPLVVHVFPSRNYRGRPAGHGGGCRCHECRTAEGP